MVDKLFLSKWQYLVLWSVSLNISECFHVFGNIASMSGAFCVIWYICAGILEQSRNRVGIGLSHRPVRLHRLAESIPGLLKSLKIPPLNVLHSVEQFEESCPSRETWGIFVAFKGTKACRKIKPWLVYFQESGKMKITKRTIREKRIKCRITTSLLRGVTGFCTLLGYGIYTQSTPVSHQQILSHPIHPNTHRLRSNHRVHILL